MQIYELNKNIVSEAGLLSKAYDMAHKASRNYLASKTGLHPDWFKGTPKEKPVVTPGPVPNVPDNADVPAYLRKGKQVPGVNAPETTPADPTATAEPTAPATTAPATTAPTTTTPATPAPAATGPKLTTTQINQAIAGIRTRDLQSIKKNIDAVLLSRQKPVAPGANAMSNMAGQLTSKPTVSSTGGTTTPTPTGVVHTAKTPATTTQPVAKKKTTTATAKPVAKTKPTKVSAPPPSGAPTPAEYANLEKRLQQAMKAKGRVK